MTEACSFTFNDFYLWYKCIYYLLSVVKPWDTVCAKGSTTFVVPSAVPWLVHHSSITSEQYNLIPTLFIDGSYNIKLRLCYIVLNFLKNI